MNTNDEWDRQNLSHWRRRRK